MPVQSGFTTDIIANGVGPGLAFTIGDADRGFLCIYIKRFSGQLIFSSAELRFTANRLVNSVVSSTPGLMYQLADYHSNNSLKLSNINDSGTLVSANPKAAFKRYTTNRKR